MPVEGAPVRVTSTWSLASFSHLAISQIVVSAHWEQNGSNIASQMNIGHGFNPVKKLASQFPNTF